MLSPIHWQPLMKYPLALVSSFVLALILTPAARALARRLGAIDHPDGRRIHDRPTPRGGGWAVILAFHAGCALFYFVLWPALPLTLDMRWWGAFALASTALALVGSYDDLRGMKPWVKLLGQAVAATLMYLHAPDAFSTFLGQPLPVAAGYALTLLWFLALINAFNLIDGLDGLACGLAMISAVGLMLSLVFRRMSGDAVILLALVGACAGFLRYNFYPASIFLGDTGSMFLGFALASVALATSGKSTLMAAVGIPLMAAGIPLFDTMLAIWRRSMKRLLNPPVAGSGAEGILRADREHVHHRILYGGLSQRHVALLLYAANIALVAIGLLAMTFQARSMGILLLAFVLGVYVVFRHIARAELWHTGQALIRGLQRPASKTLASLSYLLWDLGVLSLALWLAVRLAPLGPGAQPVRWQWFDNWPLWVSPVFFALLAAKSYTRVWSMAGLRDYVTLALWLLAGLGIGVGIQLTFHPSVFVGRAELMNRLMLFAGFGFAGVLFGRIVFRAVRELVRRSDESSGGAAVRRALLCGVDQAGLPYVHDARWLIRSGEPTFDLVGLVDADPNLTGRLVQGKPVLGVLDALPLLIERYRVDALILPAEAADATRRAVLGKAGNTPVIEVGLVRRELRPASVAV